MAYTNKTENYDLPQYIGSDKPTYLGDFNTAMELIDEAIYNAYEESQSAKANANTANETANNANSVASGANQNATNALSVANSANQSATSAVSTATSALNVANNNTARLDGVDEKLVDEGGIVLWTNPAPNSDFNPQTINLINNECDTYEIIFKLNKDTNYVFNTSKLRLGYPTIMIYDYDVRYRRLVSATSNTNMTFGDGQEFGASINLPNIMVPYKVIGYKTGWFE